jgi:hypothetical protein
MRQQSCRFQRIRIHAKKEMFLAGNTVHFINLLPPLFSKLPLKPLWISAALTTRAEHGIGWKTSLSNFINILISTFRTCSPQIVSSYKIVQPTYFNSVAISSCTLGR